MHISVFMRSGTAVEFSCSMNCQLPKREETESPCWGARGSASCCLRSLLSLPPGLRGPSACSEQPATIQGARAPDPPAAGILRLGGGRQPGVLPPQALPSWLLDGARQSGDGGKGAFQFFLSPRKKAKPVIREEFTAH